MNQNSSREQSLLVVEERYFSGVLVRFRYQSLTIFRSAFLWGSIFALFWVGLFTFRSPELTSPPIWKVGFVTFSFAACLSMLREFGWRSLSITSDNLYLTLGSGKLYRRSLESIRNIEILSHTGLNIAVRINWKQSSKAWIVSGTMIDTNLDDFINSPIVNVKNCKSNVDYK